MKPDDWEQRLEDIYKINNQQPAEKWMKTFISQEIEKQHEVSFEAGVVTGAKEERQRIIKLIEEMVEAQPINNAMAVFALEALKEKLNDL
jgi:hypothetical protein